MELTIPNWSAPVRTLTGFGTAISPQTTANSTIAANATLAFAQAAGKMSFHAVGTIADASGTVVIQYTDGTNTATVTTVAAGATGTQDTMISAQTVFWQLHNNSATVAAKVWFSGVVMST